MVFVPAFSHSSIAHIFVGTLGSSGRSNHNIVCRSWYRTLQDKSKN